MTTQNLPIHQGMRMRHTSEPTWPNITIGSIHTTDLPSFAGRTIPPFAWVTWDDKPNQQEAMNLANILANWEDTGV